MKIIKNTVRNAGDRWLIRGPMDFIPCVNVKIEGERFAIPLNKDEGIYVQNTKTGHVSTVIGRTYMLNEDEKLWEKNLPIKIENLINANRQSVMPRNKTRVINYCVPNNRIIKVYNYKSKNAR